MGYRRWEQLGINVDAPEAMDIRRFNRHTPFPVADNTDILRMLDIEQDMPATSLWRRMAFSIKELIRPRTMSAEEGKAWRAKLVEAEDTVISDKRVLRLAALWVTANPKRCQEAGFLTEHDLHSLLQQPVPEQHLSPELPRPHPPAAPSPQHAGGVSGGHAGTQFPGNQSRVGLPPLPPDDYLRTPLPNASVMMQLDSLGHRDPRLAGWHMPMGPPPCATTVVTSTTKKVSGTTGIPLRPETEEVNKLHILDGRRWTQGVETASSLLTELRLRLLTEDRGRYLSSGDAEEREFLLMVIAMLLEERPQQLIQLVLNRLYLYAAATPEMRGPLQREQTVDLTLTTDQHAIQQQIAKKVRSSSKGGEGGRQATGSSGGCYTCGGNHFARHCTVNRGRGQQQQQQQHPGVQFQQRGPPAHRQQGGGQQSGPPQGGSGY